MGACTGKLRLGSYAEPKPEPGELFTYQVFAAAADRRASPLHFAARVNVILARIRIHRTDPFPHLDSTDSHDPGLPETRFRGAEC